MGNELKTERISRIEVSRIEVIDEKGRQFVRGIEDLEIEFSLQDGYNTLKIFVTPLSKKENENENI